MATMRNCEAFYTRPIVDGIARGPLVAYAGTYDGPDGERLRYVGETYVNFAKVEEDPDSLALFAEEMALKIEKCGLPAVEEYLDSEGDEASLVLVGMPMAAIMFTNQVGSFLSCRTIFFEKKVIEPAKDGKKEVSELVQGRHQAHPGEKVIIVEELVNNISTAGKAVKLAESTGGEVIAIACAYNRSYPFKDHFVVDDGRKIPIIAVIENSFPQYRQDDPVVKADVEAGNVVWDAKHEWSRLREAMEKGS
ncbi:MAG TPA: hypothetical protein VN420_04595 [Candidatus Fimivivens sp.]|nr:hypothetical protein [Candidatus Fimivivens sp.]